MKAKSDSIWKGGDKKKKNSLTVSCFQVQTGRHTLTPDFLGVNNETEKENKHFFPLKFLLLGI